MKKIIAITILVLWLGAIFYSSSMDANSSGEKSGQMIEVGLKYVTEKTNSFGWTDIQEDEFPELIEELQRPFRKSAHAIVFGSLALLMMVLFTKSKLNMFFRALVTTILCLIYAITDEYHQLHVPGRTGQWSDVVIDMYGVAIGISIYLIFYGLVKLIKKNQKPNEPKIES